MSLNSDNLVTQSPLGKVSGYISHYQPDLLFAIPRKVNRDEIRVSEPLPFKGVDVWNAYELSCLNAKGKPVVALGEFIFPCETPNLIESKSFKLYLNSFNNSHFATTEEVVATLKKDLTKAAGMPVDVKVTPISATPPSYQVFKGICLDELDIECDTYHISPTYLQVEKDKIVTETVYSNLLKSNCLVTGQPDWASIQIAYRGNQINHAGLLKYLISFRNHNEFHEQCVERIFMDILNSCLPQTLTVEARYTRRGGLDINPFRTTETVTIPSNRPVWRQ